MVVAKSGGRYRRISISADPLLDTSHYRFGDSCWPAKWIGPGSHNPDASLGLVFRRSFELARGRKWRVHISADQCYELYVDGQLVGRGPERGDLKNWVYESYALDLAAGGHRVVVFVWWLAPAAPAPEAQQTHRPALIVLGEGEANQLLSTGVAPWEYQPLAGYSFHDHDHFNCYYATGAQLNIDGRRRNPAVERGAGEGWQQPVTLGPAALVATRWETAPWWVLRPAFLPPMYGKLLHVGVARHVEIPPRTATTDLPVDSACHLPAEAGNWNKLLAGAAPLTVPAHTLRRVLIDLGHYYCAYPQITCSGAGATVRLFWAEVL